MSASVSISSSMIVVGAVVCGESGRASHDTPPFAKDAKDGAPGRMRDADSGRCWNRRYTPSPSKSCKVFYRDTLGLDSVVPDERASGGALMGEPFRKGGFVKLQCLRSTR